ncbi:hypothetical protein L2725_22490 [Shewanella corallii]|uniref:Uncharacterized protein n=1 Tax=Shewanella corallii TaxID=560080 RepID=A0ABT0NEE4_9GAMM|nr:hypothetical protein [Shewanella corallii]MCL2916510.1 hypothetical protein [Shewanella corallii]
MKKITMILTSAMLLVASGAAEAGGVNHGKQCVDRQYISEMSFGHITGGGISPDGGNALIVHLSNGVNLPLHPHYNGNDAGGRHIIEGLRLAFAYNRQVSLWDHAGNNCDDFDAVRVHSDTY